MSEKNLPTPNNDSSVEKAGGVTRRDFLRCAGLGAASLMVAGQAQTALAANTSTVAASNNGRIVGWLTWDDHGTTKSPFVFDPQFFSGGAMKYNAHLATFGCCVALAAINAEPNGGSDGRYRNSADNIISLMHQVGCDCVEQFGRRKHMTVNGVDIDTFFIRDSGYTMDYYKKPEYDYSKYPKATLGLYAAHRKIYVDGKDYNLVMLGIRGGNYELEWCSNLTLDSTGNHQGFQEAADRAAAFLDHYIRVQGLKGPTKILIAGQSRAGATTNLAAGMIVKRAIDSHSTYDKERGYDLYPFFLNKDIEIWQSDLYAYGYGVPSGLVPADDAERQAAKEKFGNVHNIINPCDMVPKVAPAKWGFMRYGVDKVLPGPSDRSRYTAGREKMKDRLYVLANHRTDGARFSYTIDSFPTVDYGMLGPYGEDAKQMYDMKSLDVFIEDFVNAVATDVFHSRTWRQNSKHLDGYADRYQSAMITVFELYVEMPQDKYLNAKGPDGKTPLEKFTSLVKSKIMDNKTWLVGRVAVCWPLTSVITYVDEAMKAVPMNDGRGRTFDDYYGNRVRHILHRLLDYDYLDALDVECSTLTKFIKNNVQTVIAMSQKAGTVMSTHNCELCLAWLQSRDSYYSKYGKNDLPDAPALNGTTALSDDGDEAVALADDGAVASSEVDGAVAVPASADGDDEAAANGADDEVAALAEDGDVEEVDMSTVPDLDITVTELGEGEYEEDGGTDDDWADTYRKVIFNGGTSISYQVNGANYQIFENGRAVYADDEGTPISIGGQECPFIYGVDSDLQQVVLLSDGKNGLDGSTDYTFILVADPDAPVTCTAASYKTSNGFPQSVFVYESPVGCYGEPLEDYKFTVKLGELMGVSSSKTGESFESFSGDFDTPGVAWQAKAQEANVEKDSGDELADRHYYIDTRTADAQMGGTMGGGTTLRGSKSLVVAVPFDGYEFDYWTLDDKYLVDGQETSPYSYVKFTTNEDGEVERTEPESVAGGEWVEGQRVADEIFEDSHVYRVLVDGDHLVTAHFKAASAAPDDGKGDDVVDGGGTVVDGGETGNDGSNDATAAGAAKGGKAGEKVPETGDSALDFYGAAAGLLAIAGAALSRCESE